MIRAALAMSRAAADAVLDGETLAELRALVDLAEGVIDDFAGAPLRDVELLVTGWGCPPLDAAALAAAPNLRAIVHTAGSVRAHVTEACWDRGIEVTSAAAANAVPVAEYTLAMILLSGKRVLERARGYRESHVRDNWPRDVGNYRRTVGILSASMIGRRVIELLRPHDLHILVHDPYVDDIAGAERVTLAELFARSDVVSVHTPLLPETRGLVGRELIGSMRPDAVLINTARGAVLDQDALAEATGAGRIRAILDVTEPEVLPPGHPLWTDENVLITPHLAGSQGNELGRLAALAVAEVARWASGEGFAHPLRRDRMGLIA
ncbi:2-hydroxyacid dehydrogenase [Amycolatopsis sp. NBRC 101858]|uniref:hydroxyacid dehydrogenase n=1 Tax=Amycolatopsis sp. NBRC 101858 TaxID=3032200 RepID=UPI0024A0F26B|nr:hydroxyacid dehydrogenase [Amycolatopsis sp. NBRC 101858]GLY37535.1 2-hydroxyacid dehydrogenase [Amycolatopsis sp. NBRC 101858]